MIEFSGLKHLTEKVTAVASLIRVRVVVDHTMPTPLQRSTKLKIALICWSVSLPPSRLYFLSKTKNMKEEYKLFLCC